MEIAVVKAIDSVLMYAFQAEAKTRHSQREWAGGAGEGRSRGRRRVRQRQGKRQRQRDAWEEAEASGGSRVRG